MAKKQAQKIAVTFAHRFESPVKAAMKSSEPTENSAFLRCRMGSMIAVPTEEIHGEGRHECPRKQIRSEHREDHRFSKWREQIFRRSRQEENRDENNADTQG